MQSYYYCRTSRTIFGSFSQKWLSVARQFWRSPDRLRNLNVVRFSPLLTELTLYLVTRQGHRAVVSSSFCRLWSASWPSLCSVRLGLLASARVLLLPRLSEAPSVLPFPEHVIWWISCASHAAVLPRNASDRGTVRGLVPCLCKYGRQGILAFAKVTSTLASSHLLLVFSSVFLRCWSLLLKSFFSGQVTTPVFLRSTRWLPACFVSLKLFSQ